MSSLAAQKAYRQTPKGVAAAKLSHDNYIEKRRQYNRRLFDLQNIIKLLSTWGMK
jgi:hypothetical protein